MRDHDTLGPPGAAGSEDDVGEVLAMHPHRRIFGTLRGDARSFGVQVDRRRFSLRYSTERPTVGDQERDARNVEHAFQPHSWQRRLEGHIRPSCLQYAEHGHDLSKRVVDQETHASFRAGALRPQMMRQPIRTSVQVGIRQPFVAGDQGQRAGCRQDLGLERTVDGRRLRPSKGRYFLGQIRTAPGSTPRPARARYR